MSKKQIIRLVKPIKTLSTKLTKRFPLLKKRYVKISLIAVIGISFISLIFLLKPYVMPQYSYDLGHAGSLIGSVNESIASKLSFDNDKKTFNFNNGQSMQSSENVQTGANNISAIAYEDPSKGMAVTDTTNKITFSLAPKFGLGDGKQDGNRIIYPLQNGTGWVVYTMQGTGVKEDILLNRSDSDKQSFEYNLTLNEGLEARVESDGGIGIYGNTLFSSNISTSTESDAALLQKARENAQKDTLLFSIPKPVILEKDGKKSEALAVYSLMGTTLKVKVSGLLTANYPLSIDPSIYVATAQQFMNGNNETKLSLG